MNNELKLIEEDVSPVVLRAGELVVETEADLSVATDVLSQLNRWNDTVEEDRKKLTEPLNKTLKEINARYKPIREALEGAIKNVRGKLMGYATLVENKRKEAERALGERVKAGKGNLSIETALERLEKVPELDKRVIGDKGEVTFVARRKFEVVDLGKLPLEYHLANETMIRKEEKELPGVRYWIEQEPRNFRGD